MYLLGIWVIEGVLLGVWGFGVLEVVGVGCDVVDDYGYVLIGLDFFF